MPPVRSNKSLDILDLLEKLRLRRKLRLALQNGQIDSIDDVQYRHADESEERWMNSR